MNNKTAIALMGPTACGKTSLAINLSKVLPIEIINVDSAQIYIGMDIGTSKPSKEQLQTVKHHLIDICLPTSNYSVAQFCNNAICLMEEIHMRGNIPVLVGGTMLYFYGLCFGLSNLPPQNAIVRDSINTQAAKCGWPAMHAQLMQLDPEAAQNININDSVRIQRALEVITVTSKKFSDHTVAKNHNFLHNWHIDYFALLHQDRAVLHKKIADRFDDMVQQGFIEEVAKLLEQKVPIDMPAMRCVGYRQISEYLQNKTSKFDACQKAIFATRQLAKRQYTWLRKWQKKVNLNLLYAECQEEKNLQMLMDPQLNNCFNIKF